MSLGDLQYSACPRTVPLAQIPEAARRPGARTCVRGWSPACARLSAAGEEVGGGWRRRTQVQQAPRGDLGASRTRGGTGSPARSTAATTRRAAPRRPWPDPALALLRATCRRLLRAARRLPRARPMGGRASLRGGAAGYCWGKSAAPDPVALSHQSLHAPPPPGQPATAWLPTLCCLSRRRPPPRLSQDCAKGGVSCWGRSLRSERPGRSRRATPLEGRVPGEPLAGALPASPGCGAGKGFLSCPSWCV